MQTHMKQKVKLLASLQEEGVVVFDDLGNQAVKLQVHLVEVKKLSLLMSILWQLLCQPEEYRIAIIEQF